MAGFVYRNIKPEIDGFNSGWKAGRASAQAEINEALDRLWDMSLMDDGQAWKEAERFYAKYRDDWGKPKGS